MKIIKFFSIILILFFYSCNGNNENELIQKQKSEELITSENEEKEKLKIIDEISKKFNANISFDTLEYQFTYQYQNFLNQNNLIIIEDFKIINIEMKDDSSFLVSIKKGYINPKFIDFVCTKSELNKICQDPLNQEPIENYIEDRFLILKLNLVKKIKFKTDSYGEDNGDDEPNTYIEINSSDAFIFKANFIDTYLKNRNEKN